MSMTAAAERGTRAPRVPPGITERRIVLPIVILVVSLLAYGGCVAGAVLASSLAAKIVFAVFAGAFISNLAIIGHDAVHRSLTPSPWLNRVIGIIGFLPALQPSSRWEHYHNRVHHRYTTQIGIDNAYPPMTPEQYRAASRVRRLYYRFLRSLAGQPVFYLIDIWLPNMFVPRPRDIDKFGKWDWLDLSIVYVWLIAFIPGLAILVQAVSGGSFGAAFANAALFGFLIPFLVWNAFVSFLAIVQHTGPKVRWTMPTGRPSTYHQMVRGTVHVVLPEIVDWFFHRIMQHIAHHVNPVIPLYVLKAAEKEVIADAPEPLIQVWTPLYHWRMTRDCKLYDVERDCWCRFDGQPAEKPEIPAALVSVH